MYPKVPEGYPKPRYPLPTILTNELNKQGFFENNEFEEEMKFAKTAKAKGFAVELEWAGQPTTWETSGWLVDNPTTKSFEDEIEFMWGKSAVQSVKEALKRLEKPKQQFAAYMGWLTTNPQFLEERDGLRNICGQYIACKRRFPVVTQNEPWLHPSNFPRSPDDESLSQQVVEKFRDFYRRWELMTFQTWDLPEPLPLQKELPLASVKLAGLEDRPVTVFPRIIKFSGRDNLHLSTGGIDDSDVHLREWRDVQDFGTATKMGYQNWERVARLHLYRNIVLQGRYPNRFHKKIRLIDKAFATFLIGGDDESECRTIRKLRTQIAKRLKPYETAKTDD